MLKTGQAVEQGMPEVRWQRLRGLVRRYGTLRSALIIGVSCALLSMLLTLAISLPLVAPERLPMALGLSFLMPLLLAPPTSWVLLHMVADLERSEQRQRDLVDELRASMDQLKELSGLLPVCAGCKAVRDDDGYWHAVESYLRSHAGTEVSHSLCPGCVREHYPEHAERVLSRTAERRAAARERASS